MFYKIKIKDHVRIPPHYFGENLNEAVIKEAKNKFSGHISNELGLVIDVCDVEDVGKGVIIPGDGGSFYKTTLKLLTFKPEMQEVVMGTIKDITDFGAFINIGPIDGMIHISQTMDDYVSFTKDNVLQGKEKKRTLKMGDKCRAKIITISYKDITNPKIGLTMRQKGLGKEEWSEEKKENTKESDNKKKEKK
ncbi:DNA-directed RNA polymerase [Candidatus Woesearchaeota archaeon]|nr:DNA-directed RNA polymerase [Candidatus Woesearchaeota archaeon]